MNLSELIMNAGIGFVIGLNVGTSKLTNKGTGQIAQLEEILTEEEKGVMILKKDEKQRSNLSENVLTYGVSLAGAFLYTSSTAFVLDTSVKGPLFVAGLAATVGNFAGRSIRKFISRPRKKDLELLKQIRENPKEVPTLLPQGQRDVLTMAYEEVHGRMLKGPEEIEETDKSGGPIDRIDRAIFGKFRVYTPALILWGRNKLKEVVDIARIQMSLKRFYNSSGEISAGILGAPESTQLRIYEIDGGILRTLTADMAGLRIIKDDRTGITKIDSPIPEFKTESSRGWDKDYRGLATEIQRNDEVYTTVLLKVKKGMPDLVRSFLVANAFALCYNEANNKVDSTE